MWQKHIQKLKNIFYTSCATAITVAILANFWLKNISEPPPPEDMEKFDAEFMEADEFYRAFKVFKENIYEPGPQMVKDHILNHNLPPNIRVSTYHRNL